MINLFFSVDTFKQAVAKWEQRSILFLGEFTEDFKRGLSRNFYIEEREIEAGSEKTAAIVAYGNLEFLIEARAKATKYKKPCFLFFCSLSDFLAFECGKNEANCVLLARFLNLSKTTLTESFVTASEFVGQVWGEELQIIENSKFKIENEGFRVESAKFKVQNTDREASSEIVGVERWSTRTLKEKLLEVLNCYKALNQEINNKNLAKYIFCLAQLKQFQQTSMTKNTNAAKVAGRIYLDLKGVEISPYLTIIMQVLISNLTQEFLRQESFRKVGITDWGARLKYSQRNVGVDFQGDPRAALEVSPYSGKISLTIKNEISISLLNARKRELFLIGGEVLQIAREFLTVIKRDSLRFRELLKVLDENALIEAVFLSADYSSFNLITVMRDLGIV